MGSFRGSKGERGGRRRRGPGAQQDHAKGDFRWKKAAVKRKRERSALHESADAVIGDDFTEFRGDAHSSQQGGLNERKRSKESKASIKERQRQAKRRRREMHDVERRNTDILIHDAPEEFLWQKYVEWVGEKMSRAEKKAEKWSKAQVHLVEESDNTTLMASVKETIGSDYIAQGAFKKGKTAKPGVACIVIASSAVRAVHLAKSVYDGRPVGKLFSKHIKIDTQREWLATCCAKGLAPSAAGTAKRVQRLIEEGDLTLQHTVALVIDFKRDDKQRNILDFDTSKQELFDFLHQHARTLVNEGKMKLLLLAPEKPNDEPVTKEEPLETFAFVDTTGDYE